MCTPFLLMVKFCNVMFHVLPRLNWFKCKIPPPPLVPSVQQCRYFFGCLCVMRLLATHLSSSVLCGGGLSATAAFWVVRTGTVHLQVIVTLDQCLCTIKDIRITPEASLAMQFTSIMKLTIEENIPSRAYEK